MCVYVYVHVYVYVCASVYVFVYVYVYVYVNYLWMYMYRCMYMYVYVYVNVHVHVNVYGQGYVKVFVFLCSCVVCGMFGSYGAWVRVRCVRVGACGVESLVCGLGIIQMCVFLSRVLRLSCLVSDFVMGGCSFELVSV